MIKRRLNPNKILVLLLYGDYAFVERKGNGRVRIRTGALARFVRVPNARLKEYILWLESPCGLVRDVEIYHGYIELTVKYPRLFEADREKV